MRLHVIVLALCTSAAIAADPSSTAQLAAAALKSQGVKQPEVVSYTDLTREFSTSSAWALAMIQDRIPEDAEIEEHGPLHVCFLRNRSPDCRDSSDKLVVTGTSGEPPFDIQDVRVVHAAPHQTNPRLLVKTCTKYSFNGNCGIQTIVYAYNKGADQFSAVFRNMTGRNNNQSTRFVESGPLQGRVIVSLPADEAPFTYWIEIYQQEGEGSYRQVLRYRGKTGYNDGNRLAVIDSEMPEILRRLGLWKVGDPLPVPPRLPSGCTNLYLSNGVEWCR